MSSGVVNAATNPPCEIHPTIVTTTYATNYVREEIYTHWFNEYTYGTDGVVTQKYELRKRLYQTDITYYTCTKCGYSIDTKYTERLIYDGPAY